MRNTRSAPLSKVKAGNAAVHCWHNHWWSFPFAGVTSRKGPLIFIAPRIFTYEVGAGISCMASADKGFAAVGNLLASADKDSATEGILLASAEKGSDFSGKFSAATDQCLPSAANALIRHEQKVKRRKKKCFIGGSILRWWLPTDDRAKGTNCAVSGGLCVALARGLSCAHRSDMTLLQRYRFFLQDQAH